MTRKEKFRALVEEYRCSDGAWERGFDVKVEPEYYAAMFELFCGELPSSIRNHIKPDDEVYYD